ncbi:uncharacterized protein BJX67DRAFT_386668 [Aspergillus lucknowensis]|uniref:Uncharacterized protein n=1 Tax=Aspergillus lucknowensis TaxID=176173 RepID=A0ABR4L5F1_9EURO
MSGPISSSIRPMRRLREDEQYVAMEFERHAGHCNRCRNPLDVLREGRSLCKRGDQYATDVDSYLYSKNGDIYSAIGRSQRRLLRVSILPNYVAAHALLVAIENGLLLKHKCKAQTPELDPPHHSALTATVTSKRPSYADKRCCAPANRGSLYDADTADRDERVKKAPLIYHSIKRMRQHASRI